MPAVMAFGSPPYETGPPSCHPTPPLARNWGSGYPGPPTRYHPVSRTPPTSGGVGGPGGLSYGAEVPGSTALPGVTGPTNPPPGPGADGGAAPGYPGNPGTVAPQGVVKGAIGPKFAVGNCGIG